MTVVLDAGGLSMLVRSRAWLEELRRRGEWPAIVPSVALTEALTGPTGPPTVPSHESRVPAAPLAS